MEYILFVAYLVLFAWVVTKTRFFLKTGLNKSQLIIFFLLKVIAGLFYGWIGIYYGGYAQMLDTWSYHYQGIDEFKLIGTHPHEYLTNLFINNYPERWNFFASSDSYWNDLKSNVFTKLLSIFDILSFGNYYINVIFYSFLSFFGPIAFYRVMADVYPQQRMPVLLACFLIPSFFYWSSGIHKEGLIFLGIALFTYNVYFALKENKWTIVRWLGIILSIFIFFLMRNFILVLLAPAILAWLLADKWPRYTKASFAGIYLFFVILFFSLRYVDARLDFPAAVVDKQKAFLATVGGNSTIPIRQLQPHLASFVINTPQAISLSTLRPFPSDIHHLFSLAAATETFFILLLGILFITVRIRRDRPTPAIIYFLLFLSFSLLLTIGFSVNNLGAIVRYRSVALPLFVCIFAANIDWTKVGSFFSSNIKKKDNRENLEEISR